MKTSYFKILLISLIVAFIGLFIALNLYNKPFLNVAKSKPDIILNSQVLLNDYQEDEIFANKKYVDKLIQVTGEIVEISIDKGTTIVTLKDFNGLSTIICHMLAEDNLKALKLEIGNEVIIKGICTGYLLDIIMVKCVLINNGLNEE